MMPSRSKYLLDRQKLDETQRPYLEALRRLDERLNLDASSGNRVAIDRQTLTDIAPSFNRILFLEPPAKTRARRPQSVARSRNRRTPVPRQTSRGDLY